jgi:hypothetical protein
LKLGLPLGVLAAVLVAVVVIGGDGDEVGASVASSEAPYTSDVGATDEPSEDGATSEQGSGAQGGGSGSSESGGSEGQGQAPGQGTPTSAGSDSPFVGSPVGRVPKGAGRSANENAVLRTLRVFLKSISRGDGAQACAQLTADGRRAMQEKIADIAPETAGAPCSASIVLYQGGYGKKIRDPKIKKLRVRGSNATAVGPLRQPATLSKSGRLWQIERYGDDY